MGRSPRVVFWHRHFDLPDLKLAVEVGQFAAGIRRASESDE
jgi:hypothetical protein